MPATKNNGGDVLARGGVRATFRGPEVSAERWAQIFGEDSGPKPNYEKPKQNKRTKGKRVQRVEGAEKK